MAAIREEAGFRIVEADPEGSEHGAISRVDPEKIVGPLDDFREAAGRRRKAAEGAAEPEREKTGRYSLSSCVGNRDEDRPIVEFEEVVEIAVDLFGREVG